MSEVTVTKTQGVVEGNGHSTFAAALASEAPAPETPKEEK